MDKKKYQSEYYKKYNQEHKKDRSEYYKKYVQENKEYIYKQIICDVCGGTYTIYNKETHKKTMKHKNKEEIKKLTENLNIIKTAFNAISEKNN